MGRVNIMDTLKLRNIVYAGFGYRTSVKNVTSCTRSLYFKGMRNFTADFKIFGQHANTNIGNSYLLIIWQDQNLQVWSKIVYGTDTIALPDPTDMVDNKMNYLTIDNTNN